MNDLVGRLLGLGQEEGVVYLPEDLVLAQDQAVEPGRHTKQMAHGFLFDELVKRAVDVFLGDTVPLAQKCLDLAPQLGGIRGVMDIQFDTIAGAQDDDSRAIDAPAQRHQGFAGGLRGEMQPLA